MQLKHSDSHNPSDFWRTSVPRGLALFFGAFSLVNLIGDFKSPGFDANIWWIDLRFLPYGQWICFGISICLLAFAFAPPISRRWQVLVALCAGTVALLALVNSGQFYRELIKGNVKAGFPIPLSLFVSGAFAWIALAASMPSSAVLKRHRFIGISAAFLGCLLIFPFLQILCFGKTDYRRAADAAVVLGARAYADGKPSDALADRVRTACDLYKEGFAKKLILSGGPGDGAIHETESMRRFAVSLGVPDEDILADEQGLNTQATVENTLPLFQQLQARRILVVSHFYHLPRIKMTYQREGCDVYTVPAKESYFLRQTPYMVLREIAALWVYYLRPLRAGSDCGCN